MALSIPQMALMSQLLDEALPLDAAGRRAWLAGLSPEHQALASALRQALLPGETQAAEVKALSTLPKLGSAEEANPSAASSLQAGARVGPYELIRLLGVGGMAEVWLARRADGAFKRDVALKLPMLHRLQAGLEARFACERDILASLEHPHIARLYDAGVDPQGLPYLAMEYVHGEPIAAWCDVHRLGTAERLALFLQVLDAVQYAHKKQVIHRDLKPSNILVTESGQVRLLDFGVARLLESQETDQLALTSVYGRALTPDYASPELLRGDPVDVRSDLYSLGVLLYELLTSTRPYRLKRAASIGALDEAIAALEVRKPSAQLEHTSVAERPGSSEPTARQLRGDLDTIVLRTLAKDPAQRYPSVAALAEDLQSHLDGKPIRTQRARIFYRLGKFERRHRALLGVSVAALAAILAAVIYTRYRESRAQVTVAAAATDSAGDSSIAVLPFTDMSEKQDQEYFSDGLSEDLIDLLTKVPELHVPARASSFYFKGQHATIPEIAKALAVTYVLEGSVRKSGNIVRVRTELIRADKGYNVWSETYDRELKDIFKVQDEIAEQVVAALKVALPGGVKPANADQRTDNPEAYHQYLLGQHFFGRFDETGFHHAVEAYKNAIALDPRYAAAYAGLAFAESELADKIGDPTGISRAMAAAERAIVLEPGDAAGYGARGALRTTFLWDWDGAAQDFSKVISIDTDAFLPDRALLAQAQGRLAEAIALQKRAVRGNPLVALRWADLANMLINAGEFGESRTAVQRALEIEPDYSRAKWHLSELEVLEGHSDQGLASAQQITNPVWRLVAVAVAEFSLHHERESQQALNTLIRDYARIVAYQIAEIYAFRGETDQAFAWLDRAYRQRDGGLPYLKTDCILTPLRSDPRYAALVRRMRLPPE